MGSRRSNRSVKPGQKNPIDSNTIRSSSLRDYTTRPALARSTGPITPLLGKHEIENVGCRNLGSVRTPRCNWVAVQQVTQIRVPCSASERQVIGQTPRSSVRRCDPNSAVAAEPNCDPASVVQQPTLRHRELFPA